MDATAHVLLVDDRDDNLDYLSALLRGHGFVVECAHQGDEALRKAGANPPDLVISDLLMPVMDGYTLLRHWRSDPLLKRIPFIVYTATYTEPEDERLALSLGADAFILKPSEPDAFLVHLRRVLANPASVVADPKRAPAAEDTATLKQYSDALIRKLEHKTRQLQDLNLALTRESDARKEFAQTQIAILNALPANIALIDAHGVILAVNESWRRFGSVNELMAPDSGVGQNYLKACENDGRELSSPMPQIAKGIQSVLQGKQGDFTCEYPCHSPSEERWFRMMVTPLGDQKNAGAVVMHVDVTELKAAELRLRESQAQHLVILNSTAEGIYGLDLAGVCTFCNPAAAKMLGFASPEELVGSSVHRGHHHTHADGTPFDSAECRAHNPLLSGEGVHSDAEVFFRRDGASFPVEYWSHPIRKGTQVVGAVVAFLDISARRNLEAQFLQAQKMEAVGRLAGGVAHDFNNALQVIMTCAELLDEQMTGHPQERGYVREIEAAGRRGADLTRQLLAFSRKQLLRPVRMNLNTVVFGMQDMLSRLIGENIRLVLDCDPDVRTIEADASQVEQVLMNLVVNARDAMPEGGDIRIATSNVDLGEAEVQRHPQAQAGRFVTLSVKDNGLGMDAQTKARIFEPFFTTKEIGAGTGLGLSTVYGIVSQSGGFIEVTSTPEHGALFQIFFRAVDGPALIVGAPEKAKRAPRGTESIMLVEDEGALRKLIGNTLRDHGYRVLELPNGQAAVAAAMQPPTQFDLLLTDVILPDLGGPHIARVIRESRPTIKVMYITGYSDEYISRSGVLDDKTLLLEKPFTIDALLTKIRTVLDMQP